MKDTLRVVVIQGVIYGLQVVFILLAARILGPASQGHYAVLRTSVYLIELVMWYGLTSGIVYFIASDFKKYHDLLLNIAVAYIAFSFLLGLLIVKHLFPCFGFPAETGYLVVLWVSTLALLQIFQKLFLGQKRYRLYNNVYIINSLALFFTLFVYWMRGPVTLESILYCNIFSNIASIGYAFLSHRRYLVDFKISFRINFDILKELYRVGLKGYFSGIAFLVLYRLDFLFVGYYLGSRVLGIYTIGVFIIESIQKVPDWLGLILPPKVASGLDDTGKLTRRYVVVSFVFMIFVGAIIYVLNILHFEYVVFALGDKYRGVENIVLLLFPRALLHGAMVIYAANLSGKGYTLYHPLAGAISLVVLLIIDSLLIPQYGLHGAIIGITTAYCCATTIMILGYRKYAVENGDVNAWLINGGVPLAVENK